MKPVNILLDSGLRAKADAFAASKGLSLGKLVRTALSEYLNRRVERQAARRTK